MNGTTKFRRVVTDEATVGKIARALTDAVDAMPDGRVPALQVGYRPRENGYLVVLTYYQVAKLAISGFDVSAWQETDEAA